MCKKCHFDTLIYKSLPTVGRGHPLSHPPPARSLHSDPCSLATPLFVTMVNKIQIWKFDKSKLKFYIFHYVQILDQEAEQATGKQVQTCGVPRSASAARQRGGHTEGDCWQVETIPSTSVPWCLTWQLYQRSKVSDLQIFIWKKGNQIYINIWKNIKSLLPSEKEKKKERMNK